MDIDLTLLSSNSVDKIEIDEIVNIPKEYFENSDVKELNNIKVKGKIYKDLDEEISALLKVNGKMLLEDAISLEDIYYDFEINIYNKIFENEENLTNSLDLYEFLWENIVLEVPERYTKVEDISDYRGEGWSLINEEEVKETKDNPFKDLLEEME